MSAFSLDTSGVVQSGLYGMEGILWSDLSPFEQGYVEAMSGTESVDGPHSFSRWSHGFSDLAPETLAAIRKDCAGWLHIQKLLNGLDDPNSEGDGRALWKARQEGQFESFPPLTVSLGDDGKVYLRESA